MKRLLALVATAGIAVALYATTAPAGQQAVTPAQFAALKKQVTKMQKDVNLLKQVAVFTISCGFNKGAIGLTASPTLHITGAGETANFYALTTSDPECVKAINEGATFRRLSAKLGR